MCAGKVVAIVITYRPDVGVLTDLLSALIPQVDSIVIVDNGSKLDFAALVQKEFASAKITMRYMAKNVGIAAAQNEGIRCARQSNTDYILLMDHDSIPEADMVTRLLSAARTLPNVASVGPRYRDTRQNNPPPFIRIEGMRLHRCPCKNDTSIVHVDYLISSGCLIPIAAIDIVGEMRDDLFIDYVDIEWGLRAKQHGLQSYGVCGAKMMHTLGDMPITFFRKIIPLHSPLRHYYHFRNAIWLYRQPWPPLNWKMVDARRLLLKFVFYSLFTNPRLQQFKMMVLGLWHGLRGRMGALQES